MNEELLIANGVDLESALSYLGDMDMYNETIVDFEEEAISNLNDLEKTKSEERWDDYAIYAHSLKASARYLGFKELFDIAYAHEMAGKEGNKEAILSSYDELVNKTNAAINLVRTYLGE